MADRSAGEGEKPDHQPDADNEGVSTQVPAEGGDDVSPPDEGSAKG